MFGKKSAYAPNTPSAKEIWNDFKEKFPRPENGNGELSPKEIYLLRQEIRSRGIYGKEKEVIELILKNRGLKK